MGDVGSDSDYGGSNDSTSSLRNGSRKRKTTHPARAPAYWEMRESFDILHGVGLDLNTTTLPPLSLTFMYLL